MCPSDNALNAVFVKQTVSVHSYVAQLFSQKTKIPLHVDGTRGGGVLFIYHHSVHRLIGLQ